MDPGRAAQQGLEPDAVANQVEALVGGTQATQIRVGEQLVTVRVRAPADLRARADAIGQLLLTAPDGHGVRVNQIAAVSVAAGQKQLTREDLAPFVDVTARLEGRDLGSGIAAVRSTVTNLHLPQSVRVEYGGLYAQQRQSFADLAMVFATALLLSALLLTFLFGRIAWTFAALLTVLLAAAAVLVGLWIKGIELDISALMGLTMVVGMVTELVIFFLAELEATGGGGNRDLHEAGTKRLRPILMSALIAVLTLSPLALGVSRGASCSSRSPPRSSSGWSRRFRWCCSSCRRRSRRWRARPALREATRMRDRACAIAVPFGMLLLAGCAATGTSYGEQRARLVASARAEVRASSPDADDNYMESALAAIAVVPRERFVAAGQRRDAYLETPLPIGYGQTITDSYNIAVMIAAARIGPSSHVLEIGTGSGYQAAVLSGIAAQVSSIEIVDPLARQAAARLARFGYRNVEVKAGDGFAGWAERAPFDAIIVAAGAATVPPKLLAELKPGGRLVMPIGPSWAQEQVVVVAKRADGGLERCSLGRTVFVPLTGRGARPEGAAGLFDGALPLCHAAPLIRLRFVAPARRSVPRR